MKKQLFWILSIFIVSCKCEEIITTISGADQNEITTGNGNIQKVDFQALASPFEGNYINQDIDIYQR